MLLNFNMRLILFYCMEMNIICSLNKMLTYHCCILNNRSNNVNKGSFVHFKPCCITEYMFIFCLNDIKLQEMYMNLGPINFTGHLN